MEKQKMQKEVKKMKAKILVVALGLLLLLGSSAVHAAVAPDTKIRAVINEKTGETKVTVLEKDKKPAEFTLKTTDRDAIIKEIAARTGLTADQAKASAKFVVVGEKPKEKPKEKTNPKEKPKPKEELVIKVELGKNEANVKVEQRALTGSNKGKLRELRFKVPTTDKAKIIDAIVAKTGLPRDKVEASIKFVKGKPTGK